ncbi:NAD(+) synthase [Clostridium estertheticum]|uniref:NAD(+) synthase n=1 Tax=Clostridium estertheticum TaxID=238834 RepID=UPI001C7D3913|nr:NAD(+) synthase [Clostridium estertheticum]MBX4260564.1 NAD(+) synthase [Clostridium estertheticum]WLC71365.1 NAD(+) synthase [Clostridium estertheticum]
MDKTKQDEIMSEFGIPCPLQDESDEKYAHRMIEETCTFLKKYAQLAGKKGYVCNLTGGVDSFVTSMLIKKSGLELINLSLPFGINPDIEELEIEKHVIQPDVFRTYDITGPVNESLDLLHNLPSSKVDIGNTKSRIRMTVIYRIAEVYDVLVAGCTNVAELTLGMVTKFGDDAADVKPLAGITKGIIYEMAKIFNAPKAIIDKVSTSGMWDNKSNLEEVTELNHQVCMYLRGEEISNEYEAKILKLYNVSKHKRHLPVSTKDTWWVE